MKICGPKCALCGVLISIWGVIQLTLMGVFYFIHSVALIEDIPLDEEKITDIASFHTEAEKGYWQNAVNCWIAALLYLLTLVFSGHQFYVNNRTSLTM